MARNDGIDRVCARNAGYKETKIGKVQRHNERENEEYSNPDIIRERSHLNIHYKEPTGSYGEMFRQMVHDKVISTRGLKETADHYCELVFDVNTAYFHNHDGYEYAKKFYEDAYQAAIKIVGGEQYILSAVMHADERNRAMSEALGYDVYHYHLHVVYVPVVEKQILWSKRCKDKSLVGTVKETIMQVSRSKKWNSTPVVDADGNTLRRPDGKAVLRNSYSILQDDFYTAMQAAGYEDVERGEAGSGEEHLTVTQFKVLKEQERLADLQEAQIAVAAEVAQLDADKELAEDAKEQAQEELQEAQRKLKEIAPRINKMEAFAQKYTGDPEDLLPPAGALESGGSYRRNKALPLVSHLVRLLRDIYNRYLDVKSKLARLQERYDRDAEPLKKRNVQLAGKNQQLRGKADRYDRLCERLGQAQVDELMNDGNPRRRFRKEKGEQL